MRRSARPGRPFDPTDRDGYAGDQSLFAPAFVATDEELSEMVDRFSAAVAEVAEEIDGKLGKNVGAAAVGVDGR